MRTALNKWGPIPPTSGGMFQNLADDTILATPEGQAVLARVDANTCEFFSGSRDRHVRQVTLVVLKAKGL